LRFAELSVSGTEELPLASADAIAREVFKLTSVSGGVLVTRRLRFNNDGRWTSTSRTGSSTRTSGSTMLEDVETTSEALCFLPMKPEGSLPLLMVPPASGTIAISFLDDLLSVPNGF